MTFGEGGEGTSNLLKACVTHARDKYKAVSCDKIWRHRIKVHFNRQAFMFH